MIPEEFANATFENFRAETETQKAMLRNVLLYLERFDEIKDTRTNSFGFVAVFGEQRIRRIKDYEERQLMKRKHNNFGIGKTHLQMALAKELAKKYPVLVISDVTFMKEIGIARGYDDDGEKFNSMLHTAKTVPVLIWDDIGKAKPNEFRLDIYYEIISYREKEHLPIIFNSNEDEETLPERIGDAAASRLIGMAGEFFFQVEGEDYRTRGE